MNTIYIGLFRIPKNIIKEGGGGITYVGGWFCNMARFNVDA